MDELCADVEAGETEDAGGGDGAETRSPRLAFNLMQLVFKLPLVLEEAAMTGLLFTG